MSMTPEKITSYMSDCTLCPRRCHANRAAGQTGFCGQTAQLRAARAALHFWEEPCISGDCGSGTVFFSGCSLQCIFCQNHEIALGESGKVISVERLSQIFLELQEKGAANINLVTAGHFIPQVCRALELSKTHGLSIPIVYNTGSYEEVASLRLLEGLIDIWLPDLKYFSGDLSARYSSAPDYFQVATAAIAEMFRQTPATVFDSKTGLMQRGIIVRHLMLPSQAADSKKILRYLHTTYGDAIYISIMNQYTPMPGINARYPELGRKLTPQEYDEVVDYAIELGVENGFIQDGETAEESFIPTFDTSGV